MELSKRLQTVAAAVTPGHRIADVGTDHGYVPIYLVKNGLCPSACAMDVNKGRSRPRGGAHRTGRPLGQNHNEAQRRPRRAVAR